MSLETVWDHFMELLKNNPAITSVTKKKFTHLPFLYVQTTTSHVELENTLKSAAMTVMKGKRLTLEMAYVRKMEDIYIYRLRFLVPSEKMFCCGNGCMDCIRFKT
ncbi:hypothetical protein [Alkalihalobacterium chitinilyticum]|uniref:Uncharacterized protein n=1 Tax=Alkalihalobacterium chitinilyticum TaxID=2980103 RepID=A0ABT5VCM3_9BACI|nr:hypothetical protein [Alkalihalobacterium chitinilyticum]MDE5413087.1 hypothetical protein [Alkalihalobacterium chitinilyticum]